MWRLKSFLSSFALGILLLFSANVVMGQTQARLTGTVTDVTGSVVVGANVAAVNLATAISYQSSSNQTGTYVFPSLPPGLYRITCQLTGFKRFEQSGIVLETDFVRTVDVKLEVGDITETVTVEANTPLLESENSTVGQLVERSTVFNMPLASRRTASLVRLSGAISFTEEGGGSEQLPFFSMAGGRSRNQNWQLDGVNIQNNSIGTAQVMFNPPSETVEEFKVEMSNYSAEMGRAGGGFIQMTTRSGTNEFHGSMYEFLRNDSLDARTFFAPGKAPLRFNIFGVSIGGPIVKNKTFFFANYEGSRFRTGQTFASDEVPRPAERGGDFSSRVDVAILDPATGEPFTNNIIPSSRLDPIARELVKLYPNPNVTGDDVTRRPSNNFAANGVDPTDIDWYTARIDHSLGDNDRLFGRLIIGRNDQRFATTFPEVIADPRGETRDPQTNNVAVSWHHTISSSVFNELRYSILEAPQSQTSLGNGSGINGQLGLGGVNPDMFPRVRIDGLTGLGGRGQHFRRVERDTQQVINNLTWIRGAHHLKTGVNFRFSRFLNESDSSPGGLFNFTGRATGEGLATFLLGWTSSAELLDAAPVVGRTDYWAGFIMDDWKVTPKFTLNLGLRWEMDTPLWRQNNLLSNVDLTAINPVSGTPGAMIFAPFDQTGKYSTDFDKNNFGPRFGFAYRPLDSWVIRGGYGIFYNGAFLNIAGVMTAGYNQEADFTSPDGGFTPAFLFRDGMPPPPPTEQLGPDFGAVPVGQGPVLSPQFMQRNHPNGYHQQWNLSIQKQLPSNMLVEIGYLANVAHKLVGTNTSINMIPLVNGLGPERQDQTVRPFPQFNDVTHVAGPPWGNSSYHALNLKFEKRYSQGLSFLTNYSWSKYLDDVEASTELGAVAPHTHIELRHLDKSLAGSDLRHRLVASTVYDLPWGRGRRFDVSNGVLNQIVGGWTLAFIGEFRTGPPFGVWELTNRSNTFSVSQRPHLLRDPEIQGSRPRAEELTQWFDTSAFVAPGAGVFGSAPRAICCGPGFIGIDLSIQKWFSLTERWRLQFRSDFENLPNRPNFGIPANRRGGGDFGRVSSTRGTGRQIQFALRLEF